MAYDDEINARRPRRLRSLLAIAAASALFCCVGAAGLGLWNLQAVRRAADPARKGAEALLHDLAEGDGAHAYDRLCAATRQRMPRAAFLDWLAHQPKLRRFEISDVKVVTNGRGLKATVKARLTWDSGLVDPRDLPLVRDDGHWKVCGNPF